MVKDGFVAISLLSFLTQLVNDVIISVYLCTVYHVGSY